MPSATDKFRQVGDMWEREVALLAWKLDSRGYGRRGRSRSQGHRHRSSRLPDNKRGGRNNKYKEITTSKYITRQKKSYRCSNVVRCTLHRAGIHLGMKYRLRMIIRQGVRRGGRSCRRCR